MLISLSLFHPFPLSPSLLLSHTHKYTHSSLPQPTLPLSQEKDVERAKGMFSAILQSLPLHHSIPLRLLIQFLSYVASHSDANFMTQHNLAICFGPTLLRWRDCLLSYFFLFLSHSLSLPPFLSPLERGIDSFCSCDFNL